jgi:hypothetical protein
MIQFTASVWADILAQSTAAGRATVLAGKFPSGGTIELLDAAASVIRTIDMGPWTVSGAYAVPGTYTDSALGGGTPAVAVFKAGATEIMRMTCGTLAGADYRLLANIVAGVPIRRGPFAVLFLPPPAPGTSQPSIVSAPTISGVARVGQTLTATPGVYAGNPVPAVARQWYSGATAISGASGLFVTLTGDELGGIITFKEVPSNSVGSITAVSNSLGPVVAADLNADAIPATIQINQGGTFDLTPYVVGGVPPYTAAVAVGYSLPTGVTLTGPMELSAAIDAPLTEEPLPTVKFDIDDSAPVAATLPEFGLLSETGGTNLPFTAAHPFDEGAVTAGNSVVADGLSTWQCIPINTWPDGSIRLAWVSGRATLTQNVARTLQLSVGPANAGTHQSLATLRAGLTSGSVQVAGDTIDLPTLIAETPFDLFGNGTNAIFTGPECSYWIWRRRVAGTAHLELFVPIRLYAGGAIEVITPWVQNGDFLVPAPTAYTIGITLTLNGTVRYSQPSVTIYHHQVLPLVNGDSTSRSYWYSGTDPKVIPLHDTAAIQATKLTPKYRSLTPSSTKLDSLTQTYTPGWKGNTTTGMSDPGASPHIGPLPQWCALYLTSGGDRRAYECVIANGLSAGARPAHYRDSGGYGENTGRYLKQSSYPQASLASQMTPVIPTGTGGTPYGIDTAHQPSLAYLPWMLTGDIYFLEEQMAWVTHNYIYYNWLFRDQAEGIYHLSSREERGMAWALRSLGHLVASVPDTHTLRSEWISQLQYNVIHWHDNYVTGTEGTGLANNLGLIHRKSGVSVYQSASDLGTATPVAWYGAPWMMHFQTMALKICKDIGPDISAPAQSALDALVQFSGGFATGLAGGNSSGWPFTRFAQYVFPMQDTFAGGGDWMPSFAAAWTSYKLDQGLPEETPSAGDPIWIQNSTINYVSALQWAESSAPATALAALACAVEEGVTGAQDGWNSVTGASNFSTASMNDSPQYALEPRQ